MCIEMCISIWIVHMDSRSLTLIVIHLQTSAAIREVEPWVLVAFVLRRQIILQRQMHWRIEVFLFTASGPLPQWHSANSTQVMFGLCLFQYSNLDYLLVCIARHMSMLWGGRLSIHIGQIPANCIHYRGRGFWPHHRQARWCCLH